MALNLVNLISQFLTPQLVGSLARAVGVNEAVAQRLVAAAIPLVLGAIGTTAAAPGGAQKVVDAVSNSDPDILSKLAGALGGGNVGALSQGAGLLGGLLGGSGVASLAGALSQFSGAPQVAAQSALGAVAQATVGTIGQQDPSNWSDPQSIAALFSSQKDAIAAALPPEISKALGATGLLAGLGSLASAGVQRVTAEATSAASAASAAAAAATSAANRAQLAAQQATQQAASRSSGFPIWAIVVLVVIVLAAVWWFMTERHKTPEPAKTGLLAAPVEFVLRAAPGAQT